MPVSARRSRGFTLVETLVAIVLFTVVGVMALRLLIGAERYTRSNVEQAAVQAAARGAAQLISTEVRELEAGPATADLRLAASSDITYRAVRSAGAACAVSAVSITLRRALQYGYRAPSAGRDSLSLFVEGDPAIDSDDHWRTVPVLSVGGAGTCPDGAPALVLQTLLPPDSAALVVPDAPVRTFEVMQLRLYQSGGFSWLGTRSVSAGETTVQPVLGPLAANGMELGFRDEHGAVTTVAAGVRAVAITVRAVSENRVGITGSLRAAEDSVVTHAALRNATPE